MTSQNKETRRLTHEYTNTIKGTHEHTHTHTHTDRQIEIIYVGVSLYTKSLQLTHFHAPDSRLPRTKLHKHH